KRDAGEDQSTHQQDGGDHRPTASLTYRISGRCRRSCELLLFVTLLELLRRFRIAEFVGIKVNERKSDTMFDFAFTELVQERLPMSVLLDILSDPFRE